MPVTEKIPTILQVVPELDTGGAEQTALDVGNAIAAKGWTSIVVSEGGRMVGELEQKGTRHITLFVASKNPARIIANAFRLAALIRKHDVSVIHARSRAPAWSALIAARMTRTPFVTTYHGAYKQASKLKGWYNSVMVRSDVTIANSHWTKAFIEERYQGLKMNIAVIHRGTDFSAFEDAAIGNEALSVLRRGWGVGEGKKIILCLARLTKIKGQNILIDAMPDIVRAVPDAVLVLAGDDQGRRQYRQQLEQQINTLGLEGKVFLPGHCSDPATACTLADLVIMASIVPETFGRVAVEAQAAGTPAIVTDIGAGGETVLTPPEVNDDQRTGWRVPHGDAAAMAETVIEVFSMDAAKLDTLTKRARSRVLASFSVENMCEKTIAVYRGLLSDRG